jgi:hypothetical protein
MTQVKFLLSTYLNVGLGFILVTEIQVIAIIIEDTKTGYLPDQTLSFHAGDRNLIYDANCSTAATIYVVNPHILRFTLH